jgi:hypothetical protein
VFLATAPTGVQAWSLLQAKTLSVSAADQTVTVDAGFTVAELQVALSKEHQCLPLAAVETFGRLLAGVPGSVGGLLAMNLPHGLTSQHGGPREWLLQAEVEFHGEPAKAGAKVVKSVAGYDVHKVFVGSRGLLGPITRVTLRTCPTRAVLSPSATPVRDWNGEDVWILRTLPTEFDLAVEQSQGLFALDRPSCTIWAGVRPEPPLESWMIGPRGEEWRDNVNPDLENRLKDVFDPEGVWV